MRSVIYYQEKLFVHSGLHLENLYLLHRSLNDASGSGILYVSIGSLVSLTYT